MKRIRCLSILLAIVLVFWHGIGKAVAENIDPDDDGANYAWGENVGWITLEPLGEGGPGAEVGDSELTGYMWGENVGWINLSPANGGVANDGDGNLTGYAWGENVGWINFAPDFGGVTIDPGTGEFSGYAWGGNIGWINFAPNSIPVKTSWRGVQTYYRDADGDGYGDPDVFQEASSPPSGYVGNPDDCDDTDVDINPDAAETCNGADDNCDGTNDEGLPQHTYYADGDEDGYGNAGSALGSCFASPPTGYVSDNTDCVDTDSTVNPGATEECNGKDDDCDGAIDDGFDQDGDGFTTCGGDCNDGDNSVNPGTAEVCNGKDDDCDDAIDEGFDADGDGFTT